jgi:hypothetical protein
MNADYTGVEGTASRWSEESLGFIEACLNLFSFSKIFQPVVYSGHCPKDVKA